MSQTIIKLFCTIITVYDV